LVPEEERRQQQRQQRQQQRVQQLADSAVDAELAELDGGALQAMLAASRTVPGGDSIGAFFAHVAATAAQQQPPSQAQAQAQGRPSMGGSQASLAAAGAGGSAAVRVDAATSVGLMQQAAVLIRGLHEELQKSRTEVRGGGARLHACGACLHVGMVASVISCRQKMAPADQHACMMPICAPPAHPLVHSPSKDAGQQ
jgi:hypothetical protein